MSISRIRWRMPGAFPGISPPGIRRRPSYRGCAKVVLAESWRTRAASSELLRTRTKNQKPLTAKFAKKSRGGRGEKPEPTSAQLHLQTGGFHPNAGHCGAERC